jgi:hypothetical protein
MAVDPLAQEATSATEGLTDTAETADGQATRGADAARMETQEDVWAVVAAAAVPPPPRGSKA